jgi:hypothetical protein
VQTRHALLPTSPERMQQVELKHQVVVPSPTLAQSFVCSDFYVCKRCLLQRRGRTCKPPGVRNPEANTEPEEAPAHPAPCTFSVCNRIFRTGQALHDHKRAHTGTKFVCGRRGCGFRSQRLKRFSKHAIDFDHPEEADITYC